MKLRFPTACFVAIVVCPPVPSAASEISSRGAAAQTALLDSLMLHQYYDQAVVESVRLLRHSYRSHGLEHASTIEALERFCVIADVTGDDIWLDLAPLFLALAREVYGPDHPKSAAALARYALMFSRKRNFKEALPLMEEAMRMIRPHKHEDWRTYSDILETYGHYSRWNDQKRAVDVKAEALEIRREGLESPHIDIANNLIWLGFTMFYNGDHEEGLEYMEEGEEQLLALGLDHLWEMGTIQGVRGEWHVLRGELEEAERAFTRCAILHNDARDHFLPGFGALARHGYNMLPHVQIELGKEVEAWQSLQRYREMTTVDYLVLHGVKWQSPHEHERILALGRAYLQAHARRSAADPDGDRDAYWTLLLDEIERKATLDTLRRSCLLSHRPPIVTVEELQSALGKRSAYVGWLVAPFGDYHLNSKGDVLHVVWAFVIRPTGKIHWVPIVKTRGLEERNQLLGRVLNRMWPKLEDWGLRLEPDARMYAEARMAGETLMAPLEPYLQDVDELVVEYSEMATDFPIETLVATDGRYYGERYAISYAPSARAFLMVTGVRAVGNPAEYRLLAVGDPVFFSSGGEATRQDTGDPHEAAHAPTASGNLDRLGRLAYAKTEIQTLVDIFHDSKALVGEAASEKNVGEHAASGEIQTFDILHFATHALINTGAPERSMLVLSRTSAGASRRDDGVIDAREITYGWDVDAALVALSACRTARGNASRGEPRSFMQAWFGAGARSILASAWRVDDEATYILMKRFYENLTGRYQGDRGWGPARPTSKGRALREARLFVRDYEDEDGSHPFQHPYYWAGFTLVGDPR